MILIKKLPQVHESLRIHIFQKVALNFSRKYETCRHKNIITSRGKSVDIIPDT